MTFRHRDVSILMQKLYSTFKLSYFGVLIHYSFDFKEAKEAIICFYPSSEYISPASGSEARTHTY